MSRRADSADARLEPGISLRAWGCRVHCGQCRIHAGWPWSRRLASPRSRSSLRATRRRCSRPAVSSPPSPPTRRSKGATKR
eukprot:6193485-Pleurochrysis_carterae.AAC.4